MQGTKGDERSAHFARVLAEIDEIRALVVELAKLESERRELLSFAQPMVSRAH
jgi:hypothetical protein